MTENQVEEKTGRQPSDEENITIIEKNIHRTNLRRLIDTLYLFVPIGLAFAGCFLASPLWTKLQKNKDLPVPQWFRFVCAIILFAIAVTFVFIKTRKINPIMKIGIFSAKKEDA